MTEIIRLWVVLGRNSTPSPEWLKSGFKALFGHPCSSMHTKPELERFKQTTSARGCWGYYWRL